MCVTALIYGRAHSTTARLQWRCASLVLTLPLAAKPEVFRACSVMFGMGQNHRGSGDGSPQRGPARDRAMVGGLGDEAPRSWRSSKVVTSKFYAFLVVFHTFSPIYACFFRACRHRSTKSAKWGAFGTGCPSCLQVGGNCPLWPPGSAAYVFLIAIFSTETCSPARASLNEFCQTMPLGTYNANSKPTLSVLKNESKNIYVLNFSLICTSGVAAHNSTTAWPYKVSQKFFFCFNFENG